MEIESDIPQSPRHVETNGWQTILTGLIPYLLTASFCLWVVLDDSRNIPPVATMMLTVFVALVGVGILFVPEISDSL